MSKKGSQNENLILKVEYYHLTQLYIASLNSENMRSWGKRTMGKEALSPVWQNKEYIEPKNSYETKESEITN